MIATQRAVRGPRPASPCTHLRGAPAATLGNHHVANGVENRRWGDRRRTGVPRRARRPRTLQSTQHKTRVTARCGGGAQEQQGPKVRAPRPCCPNHTRALATRHREKEVALGMHGGYRVARHPSTLTGYPINVDAGNSNPLWLWGVLRCGSCHFPSPPATHEASTKHPRGALWQVWQVWSLGQVWQVGQVGQVGPLGKASAHQLRVLWRNRPSKQPHLRGEAEGPGPVRPRRFWGQLLGRNAGGHGGWCRGVGGE